MSRYIVVAMTGASGAVYGLKLCRELLRAGVRITLLVSAAGQQVLREECGLDVELLDLLNVYSFAGLTPVVITYTARALGGTLAVDDEGLEAAWFAPDEIPWEDLAFRNTHAALREFLRRLGSTEA